MKKGLSEEQIIGFSREAEVGIVNVKLCRKHAFSEEGCYLWRSKFARNERLRCQAPEGFGAGKCPAQALAGVIPARERCHERGCEK